MKHSVLRILTLLCAAGMLLSVLAACADGTPADSAPTANPTKEETPTATPTEEAQIVYAADLPAGLDYGGEEFNVYTYPENIFVWKDFDWQNNGMDGDRIGQAVFRRTEEVNEKLGVTITSFQGNSYANPAELTKAVSTNDPLFDIANVTMLMHISMVQNGYLVEIGDLDKLDTDAPWWDKNILSEMSVSGMNFCLLGDIGTMYKRSISCILFNKVMLNDRRMTSPYTLMENGKWTLENFVDMASEVHMDLDSNDVYDDKDMYGLIYFSNVITALEIGSGVKFAEKNEDDIPEMCLNNDTTVEVLNFVSDLLYDEQLSYNIYAHSQSEQVMWDMFMANQALFYYGELHSAEDLRRMENDFGILPIPTYDNGEAYHHTVNPNVAAVLVIPKTNTDMDKTAYVLDALGAASKNILTPAYYELNLMGVVSRDEESTVSLDIIFSTVAYDPGFLFLRGASEMLRNLCVKRSLDFSSAYASIADSLDSEIAKIVDAIDSKY